MTGSADYTNLHARSRRLKELTSWADILRLRWHLLLRLLADVPISLALPHD